jgi:Ion channel
VATEAAATGDSPSPRRYGLLLASALVLLAVQGVFPAGPVQQVLVAALAGGCLLLALRAAAIGRALIRVAAALVVAVLALSLVGATAGGIGAGTARLCVAALLALGPPAVALGVIGDVRASGRVQVHAISGVLALYLLLGMAFAFLYGAIDRLGDRDFFASGADASVSLCLYFSFTTLTTVGYGDLVAASDLGRTLAIFEALLGQIYLVTVVSLLVGNLGRPARVPPPPARG